jgi:hypothetical protein
LTAAFLTCLSPFKEIFTYIRPRALLSTPSPQFLYYRLSIILCDTNNAVKHTGYERVLNGKSLNYGYQHVNNTGKEKWFRRKAALFYAI